MFWCFGQGQTLGYAGRVCSSCDLGEGRGIYCGLG